MAFLNSYLFWKYPLVDFYFLSLGKRKSVNADIKSLFFWHLWTNILTKKKHLTFRTSGSVELNCGFKIHTALANVALLVGVLSVHKVASSIPSQGTYPAGSIPWSGSHTEGNCFSPALSSPFPTLSSLNQFKIKNTDYFLYAWLFLKKTTSTIILPTIFW